MNDQHPITPPPELVQQCWDELRDQTQVLDAAKAWDKAIALAYRAGADQELEACCELTRDNDGYDAALGLRASRRPEPQPVAVSERLPGDELCWWFEPDEDDGYGGMWTLLRIRGGTTRYTHWLPSSALPTPEATND